MLIKELKDLIQTQYIHELEKPSIFVLNTIPIKISVT